MSFGTFCWMSTEPTAGCMLWTLPFYNKTKMCQCFCKYEKSCCNTQHNRIYLTNKTDSTKPNQFNETDAKEKRHISFQFPPNHKLIQRIRVRIANGSIVTRGWILNWIEWKYWASSVWCCRFSSTFKNFFAMFRHKPILNGIEPFALLIFCSWIFNFWKGKCQWSDRNFGHLSDTFIRKVSDFKEFFPKV